MAWKQDLAKLKQQLEPEAPGPARKSMPKPAPRPGGPAALDDEDAVFLSAMGLRPALPRPVPAEAIPASTSSPEAGSSSPTTASALENPVTPAPETFQEAVQELRGLKPLRKGLVDRPATPPRPVAMNPASAPPPTPAPSPVPASPQEPVAAPDPVVTLESTATMVRPLRFQLAAGMAIEVDGTLDLRAHSLSDAMDRLKDRLGDGMLLGWRSLQVTLGPDPALHEGLLALLASGDTPMVARYAQAPVPMGGTQAWILYFGPPPAQP